MSMFFFVKMLMSFEQDAHEVFEMLEVIAILTCGTVIACVVGLPPLRLAAIGRLLSQGVFFLIVQELLLSLQRETVVKIVSYCKAKQIILR